jgi:hypothetical protein
MVGVGGRGGVRAWARGLGLRAMDEVEVEVGFGARLRSKLGCAAVTWC